MLHVFIPLSFSALVTPSQATPESSSPAQNPMPARHQNVLHAVLNPSHHHTSSVSSSFHDILPPPATISLVPPPSSFSMSSHSNFTLLPPDPAPDHSTLRPVPVVLAASLPKLPPTPSGAPPPAFPPSLLTLAPSSQNYTSALTKAPVSNFQRVTSALPGIQFEPDHPIMHL